ncbi:MAG: tetratricopeptide repeat protein [Candidatus Heimdallarchaeota archaeon]|nr:tetratricopeptide repeat protein [Candidatus Heimdallarchaeota archaeon]
MDDLLYLMDLIHRGEYHQAVEESNCDCKSFIGSRVAELLGNFQRAKEIAEKSSRAHSQLLNSIALTYALWRLNEFDSAKMIISGIYSHIQDNYTKAMALNIEGLVFWTENLDIKYSLDLFQKAYNLRVKLDVPSDIGYALNNIGNAYFKLQDIDLAEKFFQQSFELRQEIEYLPGIAASYNSIGRIHEYKNEYDPALESYLTSLKLWKKVGNNQFIAKSHRFLGSLYGKMEEKDLSVTHLKLAMNIFEQIPNPMDFTITSDLLDKMLL